MINRNLSHSDAMHLLDLVHTITFCSNKNELQGVITGLSEVMSFDYAVCGTARLDSIGRVISYQVVNFNYPSEWLKLYAAGNYHTIDPVIKENFSSFSLQYWRNTFKKYRTNRKFLATAADFGLQDGYTHGLQDSRKGEGSLFSFAGNYVESNQRTESILEFIIPHLNQALNRVLSGRSNGKNQSHLSSREQEVLNWLGRGKSTWDISIILGVSERTVNFHINNVKVKLDAVNRCQAVAIGVDCGLIDLT